MISIRNHQSREDKTGVLGTGMIGIGIFCRDSYRKNANISEDFDR